MADTIYTVIETEIDLRSAERLMTEAERIAVVDFVAARPQAGDVIPGAGGLRKVRVSLERSPSKWTSVRRKRARQNKGLEPSAPFQCDRARL